MWLETVSVPAPNQTEKTPPDLSETQKPSLKRKLDATEDNTPVKIPHKDTPDVSDTGKLGSENKTLSTTLTLNSKPPNQTENMDVLEAEVLSSPVAQQENLTVKVTAQPSSTSNLPDRSVSIEEKVMQIKVNNTSPKAVKPMEKQLDQESQPTVVNRDSSPPKQDATLVKAVHTSPIITPEKISSPKGSPSTNVEIAPIIEEVNTATEASHAAKVKPDKPKAKQAPKTVATHAKQPLKTAEKASKAQTANRILKERLEEKTKLLQRAQALTRQNRLKKLGILKETRSANRRDNSSPIRSTSNMSRAKPTNSLASSSNRAQTKANLNLKLDEALANMKQLATKKVAPLVVPNEFINESAPDTSPRKSGNPRMVGNGAESCGEETRRTSAVY